MWSHSLPVNHQSNDPSHPASASFTRRHRNTLLATTLALILTLVLVVWQHKAATVANQSSRPTNTKLTPQPSSAALFTAPDPTPSSITNDNNSTSQLKVNDKSIAVPSNGSTHTVVPSTDGNTSVDFSTESHTEGSGQSSSSSSTSIQVRSNGETEVDVMNSE